MTSPNDDLPPWEQLVRLLLTGPWEYRGGDLVRLCVGGGAAWVCQKEWTTKYALTCPECGFAREESRPWEWRVVEDEGDNKNGGWMLKGQCETEEEAMRAADQALVNLGWTLTDPDWSYEDYGEDEEEPP